MSGKLTVVEFARTLAPSTTRQSTSPEMRSRLPHWRDSMP